VDFDDDLYVAENTRVQGGLTRDNIVWAFTSTHAANWHPLAWLSHMMDVQFFGMNSGCHHLTNVFFHIMNTLLLYFVFRKMTGDAWRSGAVAILFGIHPLHVETVAWIAERKDVLSTFFCFLAIWGYIRYVGMPTIRNYILVFISFGLGLMAKPMIVTLPFLLLLLDYWPLGRFQQTDGLHSDRGLRTRIFSLIWEKLPLLMLTTGFCVITFLVQKSGGALRSLTAYPFHVRLANALVSYAVYMKQTLWPFKLSVFYPYRSALGAGEILGAFLLIVFISVMVLRQIVKRPWFAVGWFWYLGILVPVIGLVQAGSQAMADRYTYVPLVGLFITIAWAVPDRFMEKRYNQVWTSTVSTIIILCFASIASIQAGYWKNSITLLKRAIEVTPDNYAPRNNLGMALERLGRIDEAIYFYQEALHINPNYTQALNNLGRAMEKQGKIVEAIQHYSKALQMNPNLSEAHNNLGNALVKQGKYSDAVKHYSEALRLNPEYAQAYYNLGNARFYQGNYEEAVSAYEKALRIQPDYAEAYVNLGVTLAAQGKFDTAIVQFREALRIRPGDEDAQYNLKQIGKTIDGFR
jgi:Flp pilus assembly protein TadD